MNIGHLVRRAVETVPATTSCTEAARRMRDADVGSVIVVDAGRPLGIVTDRDLVVRVLATGADPEELSVDVPQADLRLAGALRRIPVVDDNHQVVGVVVRDNVILSLSSELAAVAETIRKEM